MSEQDLRLQMAEMDARYSKRLVRIERSSKFNMLVIVYWGIANMLAPRVDDIYGFMAWVGSLGLGGFVIWSIRYAQRDTEPSRTTN